MAPTDTFTVLEPGATPRVLYLTGGSDDYVADGLMHGLRLLLGERVVDLPKVAQLYDDQSPAQLGRRYGRGFTLYGGLLPDIEVDRTWITERAREGEFDLVVVADTWRRSGALLELLAVLPSSGTKLVVVDGADTPKMYPYAPGFWRVPGGLALPRAHRRALYFKREITEVTAFWRAFGLLPGKVGERLGLLRKLRTIGISIPEQHVIGSASEGERTRRFQSHIVDPELAELTGGTVAKPFTSQDEYYADLRSSRFGITVKREGWDAMRHHEIAAAGAIPCFRHLASKPPRCAPHGLVDGVNCLAYDDAAALNARIDALSPGDEARLREGALAWARDHTTRAEALRFLAACGWPQAAG